MTTRKLNPAEIARRYNRAQRTVRDWCKAGLLPGAVCIEGRAWQVPEAALDGFVPPKRGGKREAKR